MVGNGHQEVGRPAPIAPSPALEVLNRLESPPKEALYFFAPFTRFQRSKARGHVSVSPFGESPFVSRSGNTSQVIHALAGLSAPTRPTRAAPRRPPPDSRISVDHRAAELPWQAH